jgi:hypothetical protein
MSLFILGSVHFIDSSGFVGGWSWMLYWILDGKYSLFGH